MARKTDEQKAAEEQQRADAAWWASPVGQAQQALNAGARFFEIELQHSKIRGFAVPMMGPASRTTRRDVAPDLLGQIEQVGWRLEQASWVYVQTGQNSRDKFLASGQQVVVTGEVIGIFLFRNRNYG